MDHQFPRIVNWQSTPTEIYTEHGHYLSVLLLAMICRALPTKWLVKPWTIWAWTIAIVGLPITIAMTAPHLDPDISSDHWPYFGMYVVLFWVVCGSGMVRTHRHLRKLQQKSQLGCASELLAMLVFLLLLGVLTAHGSSGFHYREAARRSQCRSNLKQIGIALHNFHDVYGHFPAPTVGEPAVSWRVHISPFLDSSDLFDRYDQTKFWNSIENDPISKQPITSWLCPSTEVTDDDHGRRLTHYAMVTGEKTIGDHQSTTSLDDFTDGTSNTLAVVEAAGLNIVWTEPRDSEAGNNNLGINLTGPTPTESSALISAWHRGGGNVLLADGSVRYLWHDIDPAVLKALTTANGGEKIPEQD